MAPVLDELTCGRSQMDLPLASFDMLATELLDKVFGMCRLHLDMTLNQYHAIWWDMVEMENEVCAAANREADRLHKAMHSAKTTKERRRLKEEWEEVRGFVHAAHGVIENLFLVATQPIVDAANAARIDNPDDWFSNCVSNDRACEHCGTMTLRQMIEEEEKHCHEPDEG